MGYKIHPVTGRRFEYACNTKFNKIELAWAGGFFCGEGCVGYYFNRSQGGLGKNSYPRIIAQIVQVEQEPLKRFIKAIQIGEIRGPYRFESGPYVKRPQYKIQFGHFMNVQYVFCLLWPYLTSIKKEQYKEARRQYLLTYKKNSRHKEVA